jgi:malate dehydrogenase (oxaloacetate-decarboxylating)
MDIKKASLKYHKKLKGKLEITLKSPIKTKHDLSLAYTPGVAQACLEIAQNNKRAYDYTIKGNSVAVVTNGSAVLGLGNIGALAGLPVMEGKAILFKQFANIDAYPICLDTQNPDEIVNVVKLISPGFGGINLEDIKAPECFIVEEQLQNIGIPVMHDDQHGTAIVVLAALINSTKVVKKHISTIKIIINGAGSAGIAIAKLLIAFGVPAKNIVMCDSKGIIVETRKDLNAYKKIIAQKTNRNKIKGTLTDAMKVRDVFIGVSQKNIVSKAMVQSMNNNPIIIAMANPVPEIMPDIAKAAGAAVIATGRSDFPNQVNNLLAFPGIFRGALDSGATKITTKMKLASAIALAAIIRTPNTQKIIPSPLDTSVSKLVAKAVMKAK